MSIGKQENAIGRQPAYSRYLSSAIFLLLGLGTSAIIYLTAGDVSDSVSVYEVEESRKYLHDLELYGGKANVFAVEFTKWFNGLWHGKSLAYTVCCITIPIAMWLLFVDYYAPYALEPESSGRNKEHL